MANIAELLQKQGKLNESADYGEKALQLAQELKYPDIINISSEILYKIYKQKGDYNHALKYHEISIAAKDTLFNSEKLKAINNLKQNYELDKKQKAIELLEKDKKLAHQEVAIFGTSLIIVLVLALYIINYKQRKAKINQLRHDSEIKESKYLIESKQRELTLKAMHFAQQEQILSTLKEQFETLSNDHPNLIVTISEMQSSIDIYLRNNSFRDFEKYFTEVHPDFYNRIRQVAPDLSQNELKVCALIKLNLNTKQIADITHKTPKSVEVIRTNIRKKMNLAPKDNLFDSIMQI
jgi:DNA-binding CsgD family transcriptional regulator